MGFKPGWITPFDFDWTAQANQTISANGNVSIGGYTFNKTLTASEATVTTITNGTGLIWTPNSATDYNTGKTIPSLWIACTNIIPSFNPSWGVRAWFHVTGGNETANYDSAVMGIDTNAVATTSAIVLKRGRTVGAAAGLGDFFQQGSVNATGFADLNVGTLDNSNRVLVVEAQNLNAPIVKYYYGTYSSGWPRLQDMSVKLATVQSRALNFSTATAGVFTGAQRAGSGTAYTVNFAHQRVDMLIR